MNTPSNKYLKWFWLLYALIIAVAVIALVKQRGKPYKPPDSLRPKVYPTGCGTFVKSWEGYSASAYKCIGGVWTIGWGTTRYPDGTWVRPGDACTLEQAEIYFSWDLDRVIRRVQGLVGPVNLTSNQFNALVSLEYNTGRLSSSPLLSKVKENAADPTIDREFMRYVWSRGKIINGLINRRAAEYEMYSTNQ